MSASFIFVGLDANYDPDIELSPIFQNVLDYHEDGVAFWRQHGVHHPFLLPHYTGDGRHYHRNFARVGFAPKHAPLVSFVELLHVPTVGRSKLGPADLDPAHLGRVNNAIVDGQARSIFASATVIRLMRASGSFPWLSRGLVRGDALPVLYRDGNRTVYCHLHFSNYGKFQKQLESEARAIASLLALDG